MLLTFLIVRLHAMQAERNIVSANPSVRLSVCPSHSAIVSKRKNISRQTIFIT